MILALRSVDYLVIVVTLLISAVIGLYIRCTGGRQQTTSEFLMAGNNMSVFPVALSLMATYFSATSMLAFSANTYLYGSYFMVWIFGIPIGSIIVAHLYLPVFFDIGVKTAYEYLEKRFGKSIRTVTSASFAFQMIIYMSVVLYAPSLALNAVTGFPTWGVIFTLTVVCTFYCSLGGLKAVLWTDVFQSMLMYTTAFAVLVKGIMDVGGFESFLDIVETGNRTLFLNFSTNLEERYTFWNCICFGVKFALTMYATNQAQVQRLLSVPSLRHAQMALYISVPLIVIFLIFCCSNGLVIYSMYRDCDPLLRPGNTVLTSKDQMLPYALLTLFSSYPGLAGLCVAGILSASLSTVSSAMNSVTMVIVEDFIRPYCFCKKLTEPGLALIAKLLAPVLGLICLLFTFFVAKFEGLFEVTSLLFGMITAPVLGAFTLGMFTTTANEQGTLTGMMVGFALNAWMAFGFYNAKVRVPQMSRSIEGCPEFIISADNATSLNRILSTSASTSLKENKKHTFPLYRVSFLWYPIFCSLVVIFIGYVCSFIIGCIKGRESVKAIYISPVLRKWYFSSSIDVPNCNEIKLSRTDTETEEETALSVRNKGRNLKQGNNVA